MPRETDGTWGRVEGKPSRTTRAAAKLQGKNARFAFRRNRGDTKYAEAGLAVFDARAGQAEAAEYQGRG